MFSIEEVTLLQVALRTRNEIFTTMGKTVPKDHSDLLAKLTEMLVQAARNGPTVIDLPDYGTDGDWREVGQFDSTKEAVEWVRQHVGICDDFGNINLLTALDEEGEE